MKRQIVEPVECGNCHRMTQTYNVDAAGRKLCPVCITELSQWSVTLGPSETKVQVCSANYCTTIERTSHDLGCETCSAYQG
jgi:hypothetical protein